MAKKKYDEMNYWQKIKAQETDCEKADKRLTYLIYTGLAGVVFVALFKLL